MLPVFVLCDNILHMLTATASFGGPRNPDNVVYVFDAKPAVTGSEDVGSFSGPTDTLIAVALSDGEIVVDVYLYIQKFHYAYSLLLSMFRNGAGS